MDEIPIEPAPDDPAHAGMEGLIAAMRDRKAAMRELAISDVPALLADERDQSDGDGLALWEAVRLFGGGSVGGLERGAVIGRYVILQKLGAGGMGVVCAAYDPELDRKLALKLLLPGSTGDSGRTRLLREAQMLAKLSHPNVVAIHDVGTVGEQVWLAMELVHGQTLRQWLTVPRSWREVLTVMLAAGEGLAAAHAVPLLHRDFKPDNVMVGDDGRVRVMDFGLARVRPDTTLEPEASQVAPTLDALAMPVTRAGAVLGTPGYMPPEQLDGAGLTAAADQFAFCVSLWEALHGQRPFAGDNLMELIANVVGGRVLALPKGRAVPSWLRRACERGLGADPRQRWPSMRALLEALATGRRRVRVRQGLAVLGGLALFAAGAEGWRELDLARRTTACESTGSDIEAAWSPEREQALREALVATQASYAATTADKAVPWLELQAAAWREARVATCLDAEVHGRWSTETRDRSLWCLDERRMELESLVDELTRADVELLSHAVLAAASLSSVASCRDPRELELSAPPPSTELEAIRAVQADLARAGSLQRAAHYEQGLALSHEALADARALGWRPLSASAHLRLGSLLMDMGQHSEAEAELEEAYFAAEGVAPELAFHAATTLVLVVGRWLERHADGERWGRLAEARLVDVPDDDGLHRAGLSSNLAVVRDAAGDHESAARLLEQALAARERALGPAHPDVATHLVRIASIHGKTGEHERAKALLERAFAIQEHAFGPDHPDLGVTLTNLAYVHEDLGDYAEAMRLQERALALKEHALGVNHPSVAVSLNAVALLCEATGDYPRAHALLERALAINERVYGPAHARVASTCNNLALVHQAAGEHVEAKLLLQRALAIHERTYGPRHNQLVAPLHNLALSHQAAQEHDEAKALLERALSITEEALGPDHSERAGSLDALAGSHLALGAYDEAKALHEQALAIRERALGPDHPQSADSLTGLAEIALEQGRPRDAVALAERAITVREQGGVASESVAESRFVLARALWDAPPSEGRDRARAVDQAEQARDAYRAAGKGSATELEALEHWLLTHPTDPAER